MALSFYSCLFWTPTSLGMRRIFTLAHCIHMRVLTSPSVVTGHEAVEVSEFAFWWVADSVPLLCFHIRAVRNDSKAVRIAFSFLLLSLALRSNKSNATAS